MQENVKAIVDQFFSNYPKRSFRSGEHLIFNGDQSESIFYITAGIVRQYVITATGDEITETIYRPPSFFPLGPAFYHEYRQASCIAQTSVTAYIAPQKEVLAFLQREPDVLFDLVARLYRGMNGLLERIDQSLTGTALDRLVTVLGIQAKRFGEKNPQGAITVSLSQHELASLAGIARETVSRELKILQEKGVITYDHTTITINDLASLEALIETS